MNLLLWMQLLCLFFIGLSAFLFRNGYLPFKVFAILTAITALIWILSALILFVKVGITLNQKESLSFYSVLGFILAITMVVLSIIIVKQAIRYPAIHDVSSNIETPPNFIHAISLRGLNDNPLRYNAQIIRQQKKAYPDLATLESTLPVSIAFAKAKTVALEQGWSIVYMNEEEGRIEAIAQSRLLRFVDDIVIRVQAIEKGSLIDVRSASRVGKSDLGANANRIRTFFLAFKQ